MTRTTAEIITSLRAVLAELEHSLGNPADTARDPTPDISPKLAEALAKPPKTELGQTRRDVQAQPDIQPHETRQRRRPADSYKPTGFYDDDKPFDESAWLGTGDQR